MAKRYIIVCKSSAGLYNPVWHEKGFKKERKAEKFLKKYKATIGFIPHAEQEIECEIKLVDKE